MTDVKEVVIVLLHWNNAQETIGVLKSLQDVTYKNYSVLIIDNGSEDKSLELISGFLKNTKKYKSYFVINKENKGFAGGCNVALDWCYKNNKDYILFLNNDTEVDKDFLSYLVDATYKYKDGAIFSPSIYFYDRRDLLWFGGETKTSFLKMNKGMQSSLFKKPIPNKTKVTEIDFASGCAMLCKTKVIKKLRGFDENFFLYFEDVDLSFRARKLGYKIYWIPESKIYHKVSATTLPKLGSSVIHYYDVRNALLLNKKHSSIFFIFYRFIWSFFVCIKQVIKLITNKNIEISRSIMRAIFDYYIGNFGKYHE